MHLIGESVRGRGNSHRKKLIVFYSKVPRLAEHVAFEEIEEQKICRCLKCGREFNDKDLEGEFESPLEIIAKGDCKKGIKKKS
jgi:hypothetical protein